MSDILPGEQSKTTLANDLFGPDEPPIVLSRHSRIDSSFWELGLAHSIDSPPFREQISGLARNSFMPNPFFDIPFLSAALGRIGSEEKKFLYLTETIGGKTSLRMFAPATLQPCRFNGSVYARTWAHDYAPTSLPLLEMDFSGTVEENLVTALREADHPQCSALCFDMLPADSSFSRAVYEDSSLCRQVHRFNPVQRAALLPTGQASYKNLFLSGKRRQRLRRGMERLSELGQVEFETVSRFNDVLLRFEEFLLLESSGWKGRRGTSMQRIKKTAAFARQAVANMASENRCMIKSLRLNGRAVSSMILFTSDGYFYPWKIAFDEARASYSVGNLLLVHVNEALLAYPGFRGLDSLAAIDNDTANRFWPDRIDLHSMVIGIGKRAEENAAALAKEEAFRKSLKNMVKNLIRR